jgi:hypothetical protein
MLNMEFACKISQYLKRQDKRAGGQQHALGLSCQPTGHSVQTKGCKQLSQCALLIGFSFTLHVFVPLFHNGQLLPAAFGILAR